MRRVLVVVVGFVLLVAVPSCAKDHGSTTTDPTTTTAADRAPGPSTTRPASGSTTSTTGAGATVPDGPARDIEAVVLAECDRRSEALLGVVALDPDTAGEVARRETGVNRAPAADPYRCTAPGTASADLQHLAVVGPTFSDPLDVGIFDLDTGEVRTAPATKGPQSGPAIIGHDLWFVEGLRPRLLHRWTGSGRSQVVGTCPDEDTGAPDADDPVPAALSVAAYRTCIGIDSYRLLVAPDGSRLVAGGSDSVLYVDAGTGTKGRLLAASGDGVDVCRPQQWVTATSYLCLDDVVLATLDLAAGTVTYHRLAPEPPAGVRSYSPVASPDGQRVAFITCKAGDCTLQSTSITGRGEPVDVGPLPDLFDPYLLTWSRILLPAFVPHGTAFDTATATG